MKQQLKGRCLAVMYYYLGIYTINMGVKIDGLHK